METLHTASFDTPFGAMRCASSEAGLAWVELPRASGRGFAGWLRRHAPGAAVREAWAPNRRAVAQIVEFLAGKRRRFDLPLDLRATPFQRAVYDALLEVPYGETRTYAELARAVGRPRAVRAVGAANGANPLPLVVPCHRIIASGGKLGGYGGGLPLKRRLLAMEHARHPAAGDLL
jgi:methylated-DNA-[protein]-cysteine S-methyltransferase